ncbi:histidine kinase N-terminal 7TM domain-containing protein [Halorientalis marina]|uniref:histidine kinase N-terminal 7TM domain-containing protein n=1 Tax=Halorientalis marina TaxID=2931976 RepID=UPI001FF17ECF|nr:histidine kinase N-terminal 7TM domain-containing protein [Halorientalis marina]
MLPGVQSTPYTLPLVLVVGLCAAGAAIAWYQREGPAETWATFIQVSIGLWALTNLLALSFTTYTAKLWALLLFVPTIPFLVVTTFLFTVHFCGLSARITPWRRRALLAFPVAALLLSVTNGVHGLVLVDPSLETGGEYVALGYDLGLGLYAVSFLSYLIAATYLGLLLRKFRRSRNVYRRLSLVIFLTAFVLLVISLGSFARISPLPHFTLLPTSYLVMGVLLLLGTSSARLVQRLPIGRVLAPVRSRVDSTVPLARDFVMQEVDNGIVVLDAEDRVVDINATAKRMLGLERPVGREITEITRPSLVLDAGELLPVLRGEEPVHELNAEIWVETHDGERCYDITFSALDGDGDDGAETAHVVLMHDITDQKEREERLQRQTEALEGKTTQLEHQNERLDEFASIVSHDLRNPLNVAGGRLELLLADEGEELTVPRSDLEAIKDAHGRMEAIIDDALTLARQGKAITETAPVSVGSVARTAWENVETGDATAEIDCTATVEADRDRLLNVFENLFRNAVEHGSTGNQNASRSGDAVEHGSTDTASVTVTVGDVGRDDDQGFYVADDGPGIPDAEKEAVLDRGYTTSESGTGFGLAIVTDIANAHGWDVAVTDSTDGGARFEVLGVERVEAATTSD